MTVPLLHVPNQASLLYVHALAAAYRSGSWLYDPDFPSLQDPAIWEKLYRDPVARNVIMQRSHAVAGRNWQIMPGQPDHAPSIKAAKIMDGLIRKTRRFSASRLALAKGVFRGRSYGYLVGRRRPETIGDTGKRDWWIVDEIQDIDPRRIRRVQVHDEQHKLTGVRQELYSLPTDTWEPLDERVVVEMVYDDEERRLGHGCGLIESMYFFYYAKTQILRFGLQGLSRWALGLLVAKVAPDAPGSVGRSSEDVREALLDQLAKHDSSHVLAIDGRDSVEAQETSGTGHEIVMQLLQYCDDSMRALGMGSILPSGGGGEVGSLARAKVEQDTSETLIQFDADLLCDAYTHDMIEGALWQLNRANFDELCPEAVCPVMVPVQERMHDPAVSVEVIAAALGAGIPLKKDEVYEALGFSRPRDGDGEDDVFENLPPPSVNPDEMALKEKALTMKSQAPARKAG